MRLLRVTGMLEITPFEKLIKYLKLLGKKFEVDNENKVVIVHEEIEGKKCDVRLGVTKGWVWMALKCMALSEIPENIRGELIFNLLRINNDYAEVSFGIDAEGNIVLREEILEGALTLDVFLEEYGALLVGIEVFNELLKRLEKKVGAGE
ncbi:MAG: hypothetical protein ACTSVA_07580 [Candidatus Njordarchaeales archaeon]